MKHRQLTLFALCFVFLTLAGCAGAKPVSRLRYDLLGTVISTSVYGRGAEAASDALLAKVESIDLAMSAHRSDSLISQAAELAGSSFVEPDADTAATLAIALEACELSGGAFNPAIGPLTSLWGIGTDEANVPSGGDIAKALELADPRGISFDGSRLMLERQGMRADLGAVAKGYACDAAVNILREEKIKSALLDFGGNIYAYGSKPDGSPWRVGIRSPLFGDETVIGMMELTDTSVVTSGIYERYFESDGQLYHHILDPETGYPVENDLISVTVVCASSAWADALSTSCFVLGYEKGQALLNKVKQLHPEIGLRGAIFIFNDNSIKLCGELDFNLRDARFSVMS